MNQYQQFKKIVNFIFQLLKEVQSLTEQEVNEILEGSVTVKLVLYSKYSKQLNNQAKIAKKLDSIEDKQDTVNSTEPYPNEQVEIENEKLKIEEVAKKLQKSNTREEGFRVLDDFCPTKKDLQSLAIYIDIPNSRKYSIPTLRDKIIEATIGYRLRSRAIQGEPITIESEKLDVETSQDEITSTQTQTVDIKTAQLGIAESTQDEITPTPTQTEELDAETPQESQPDTIEHTLSE
jgi:hypothetical protein